VNAARLVDAVAAPLDVARRGLLSTVTRSRGLTLVVARRDTRVPVLATVQITLLLAVTATRPLWLFLFGPLVLGVPHLASDVRYLLVRRSVARSVVILAAVASALIVALRALPLAHVLVPHAARLEVLTGAIWIAAAVVAGARERRSAWPLLAMPALSALGVYVAAHPGVTRIVLAQGHNLVGVALWLLLFRRNRWAAVAPLIALAAGTGLLLSRATLDWTMRVGGLEGLGVDLWRVGATMAPGAPPVIGVSTALVFVFLQAVHYAAWLVWIPQDALAGPGMLTFRMSGRSLVRDLGVLGLGGVVAGAVVLAGAAAFDARAAVGAYMSLATFHAYLELAMLAYFVARGRSDGLDPRAATG
jgi:hypothetical protein